MPYADPERRREYDRVRSRNKRGNPEKFNADRRAIDRRRRARDPEKFREQQRSAYWADPDKARERRREWRQANIEKAKAQDRVTELKKKHGLTMGQFSRMWEDQGGRCYLCGDELSRERGAVFVDHDHSCCAPLRSCAFCRRGLACRGCNTGIGLFRDDPERMERVAGNLRRVSAETRARIAAKPVQDELPLNVTSIDRREEVAG